jgi:hypothetical protein
MSALKRLASAVRFRPWPPLLFKNYAPFSTFVHQRRVQVESIKETLIDRLSFVFWYPSGRV